jgi:16S rRNA (guanine527-N7)-methyltransferase
MPPKSPKAFTPDDLLADRTAALRLVSVSRETITRLDRFVALLLQWQRRINLVAPSTVRTLWTRHVADSLQLVALAPDARCWVDLGSGAGFPGLVIACALADQANVEVHLVESSAKKAAFLREAVRETHAPAIVHPVRIEEFVQKFDHVPDVVTARALAPLDRLLALAFPLLQAGGMGLFPKGQDVEVELTNAAKSWKIEYDLVPSRTDASGRIVRIKAMHPAIRPGSEDNVVNSKS